MLNLRFALTLSLALTMCACTNSVGLGAVSGLGAADASSPTDSSHEADAGSDGFPFVTGTTWQVDEISSVPASYHFAYLIDSDDVGVVASPLDSSLSCARMPSGSAVGLSTIVSTAHVNDDISIASDADGVLHVAYINESDARLHYSSLESSGWIDETFDALGDVEGNVNVAINSVGEPAFAYRTTEHGQAWLAHKTSLGWSIVALSFADFGRGGRAPSIAFDSSDALRVMGVADDGVTVVYGVQTDLNVAPAVSSVTSANRPISLTFVLDKSDAVHAAINSGASDSESAMQYARLNGAFWTILTLDESHTYSLSFDVAVDNVGTAGVVYAPYSSHEIRYAAIRGSTVTTVKVVDDLYDVAYNQQLEYDSAHRPHVAYVSQNSFYMAAPN